MTRISKRSTRVELQYPVEGSLSTTGKPSITWQRHGNAWVSMDKSGGIESDNGGQLQVAKQYTCKMLKVAAPAINEQWRMVVGTQAYNVLDVDDGEPNGPEFNLVVGLNASASA